jgi:hypothetical protein
MIRPRVLLQKIAKTSSANCKLRECLTRIESGSLRNFEREKEFWKVPFSPKSVVGVVNNETELELGFETQENRKTDDLQNSAAR